MSVEERSGKAGMGDEPLVTMDRDAGGSPTRRAPIWDRERDDRRLTCQMLRYGTTDNSADQNDSAPLVSGEPFISHLGALGRSSLSIAGAGFFDCTYRSIRGGIDCRVTPIGAHHTYQPYCRVLSKPAGVNIP